MNSYFLMIVVALLFVLAIVVAYNMYQENEYRKKIRSQFGHSDQDALMDVKTSSVRDGQSFGVSGGVRPLKANLAKQQSPLTTDVLPTEEDNIFRQPESVQEAEVVAAEVLAEKELIAVDDELVESVEAESVRETLVFREPVAEVQEDGLPENEPLFELAAPAEQVVSPVERAKQVFLAGGSRADLVEQLEELARNELSWFDKRFDFMAYVALPEACELQAIPRLSVRQRFQIVGCTRDGRFQVAEPIPGVLYQAFVIGLQSISRNGLVTMDELQHFTVQVQQFALNMSGQAMVEEAESFLMRAAVLDDLCARVDQTIAIHLVSRSGVLGVELRQSLEKHGFVLQEDGKFVYPSASGDVLFSVVALDGSEFTEALLASQPYKGFSMLFDITRVPSGEQSFNQFMSLAVKLSSDLALDLVDDQLQPLSTDWLKEVRTYVGGLQLEMLSVDIEAGSSLAKRLFA